MGVDELRKSRDKAIVAFQEFALLTRSNDDCLFVFFEGKDNPYYIPRIKFFYTNLQPISCGGREKVLKVHELVKNQAVYDKYKKAYFVDSDFHKPLPVLSPPVFETESYSIENFYVSSQTVREIFQNEFHLSEANDAFFNPCLALFEKLIDQYNDAIVLFNAWYACLIEIRDNTGVQTGVNLEDKFPKGFVEITLNGVNQNYDLVKILETFPNAVAVNNAVLQQKIDAFTICDKKSVFRGKYQMYFLLKFFELLLRDSANEKTIATRKINFNFGDGSGVNNGQALSIFSGYAITPVGLNDYIQTVIA